MTPLGQAEATSRLNCCVWGGWDGGADLGSCPTHTTPPPGHWSPSPRPYLRHVRGLAGVAAPDAALRARRAWAVLTFQPVALVLGVQTADLGCWGTQAGGPVLGSAGSSRSDVAVGLQQHPPRPRPWALLASPLQSEGSAAVPPAALGLLCVA